MLVHRLEAIGPAWRRTPAHQHRRIAVKAKGERMTEFVRDHVTRNIRESQRIGACAFDRDQGCVV